MATLLLDNFLNPTYSDWYSRYYTEDLEIYRAPKGHFPKPENLARYHHIILSGSEESILNDRDWIDTEMRLVRTAIDLQIPTLGLCFGHQLIARALLGSKGVRRSPTPEFGWQEVQLTLAAQVRPDSLMAGLPPAFPGFNSHFDEVSAPALAPALAAADRFAVLAKSDHCGVQAFGLRHLPVWGVQFHPEIAAADAKAYLRTLPQRYPDLELDVEALIAGAPGADGGSAEVEEEDGVARRLFENFYQSG